MKSDLPKNVRPKHGSYHLDMGGKPRKWVKLSRIKDGLPALYQALAKLHAAEIDDDRMARVITQWMEEVGQHRSKKTRANDSYMCREIGKAFEEFRASQVRAPDVAEFLRPFKGMPRSYNAYRSMLRELMRFAEEKGWRDSGTNPTSSIKTIKIRARNRYVSDSELRRIKVAACYYYRQAKDGPVKTRVRSGVMMCNMIDMAYLTGQRIGDLISMEWSQIKREGILFEPGKVENSTGVRVLIEWTPRLKELVARLKDQSKPNFRYIFAKLNGQPYVYSGMSSAWRRAVKRSGVAACTFHDLKAKALTDVDEDRGTREAQRMGGHSTEGQTATYIRHKKPQKTAATR